MDVINPAMLIAVASVIEALAKLVAAFRRR